MILTDTDLELKTNNFYYLLIILSILDNSYKEKINEYIINKNEEEIKTLMIRIYKSFTKSKKEKVKKEIKLLNEIKLESIKIDNAYFGLIFIYLSKKGNDLIKEIDDFYKYYSDIIYLRGDLNISKDIEKINNKLDKEQSENNFYKILLFSKINNIDNDLFNLLFDNIAFKLNEILQKTSTNYYYYIKYLYIINYHLVKYIKSAIEVNFDEYNEFYFNFNIQNNPNYIIDFCFNHLIKYLENEELLQLSIEHKTIIINILLSILLILDNCSIEEREKNIQIIKENLAELNILLYDLILLINKKNKLSKDFKINILDIYYNILLKNKDEIKKPRLSVNPREKIGRLDQELLTDTDNDITYLYSRYRLADELEQMDDLNFKKFVISFLLTNKDNKINHLLFKKLNKQKNSSSSSNSNSSSSSTSISSSKLQETHLIKSENKINRIDFNIEKLDKLSYIELIIFLFFIYDILNLFPLKLEEKIEYICNNIKEEREKRDELKKDIINSYKKLSDIQKKNLNNKLNQLSDNIYTNSFQYFIRDFLNFDKNIFLKLSFYLSNYNFKDPKNLFKDFKSLNYEYLYNKPNIVFDIIFNTINFYLNKLPIIIVNKFLLNIIILGFINKYNKTLLYNDDILNKLFNNFFSKIKSKYGLNNYFKYLLVLNNNSNNKIKFIDIYKIIINKSDIRYKYFNQRYKYVLDKFLTKKNGKDKSDLSKSIFIEFIFEYSLFKYLDYEKVFTKSQITSIKDVSSAIIRILEENTNNFNKDSETYKKNLEIISKNKIDFNYYDLLVFILSNDITKKIINIVHKLLSNKDNSSISDSRTISSKSYDNDYKKSFITKIINAYNHKSLSDENIIEILRVLRYISDNKKLTEKTNDDEYDDEDYEDDDDDDDDDEEDQEDKEEENLEDLEEEEDKRNKYKNYKSIKHIKLPDIDLEKSHSSISL